jgi:hypothetical protein
MNYWENGRRKDIAIYDKRWVRKGGRLVTGWDELKKSEGDIERDKRNVG